MEPHSSSIAADVHSRSAPSHLLVAPADAALPFIIDPFDRGAQLGMEDAAALVARNAGMKFDVAGACACMHASTRRKDGCGGCYRRAWMR